MKSSRQQLRLIASAASIGPALSKIRLGIGAVCVVVFGVFYWLSDEPRPVVKDPAASPGVSFPSRAVMPKPDPAAAAERERVLKQITEKQRQQALERG